MTILSLAIIEPRIAPLSPIEGIKSCSYSTIHLRPETSFNYNSWKRERQKPHNPHSHKINSDSFSVRCKALPSVSSRSSETVFVFVSTLNQRTITRTIRPRSGRSCSCLNNFVISKAITRKFQRQIRPPGCPRATTGSIQESVCSAELDTIIKSARHLAKKNERRCLVEPTAMLDKALRRDVVGNDRGAVAPGTVA